MNKVVITRLAAAFTAGLMALSLWGCEGGKDSSSDTSSITESGSSTSGSSSVQTDSLTESETTETGTIAVSDTPPQETEPPQESTGDFTLPIVTEPPQTAPAFKPLPDLTSSRYGYHQLTANEKECYDALVEAALRFENGDIILPKRISLFQAGRIFELIRLEENALYYLQYKYGKPVRNENGDVVMRLYYRYTPDQVADMNLAVEKWAEDLISRIPKGLSQVNTLKLVHDSIIQNCDYVLDAPYGVAPYGAVIKGQAFCEGYARAFALICNKLGYENCFGTGSLAGQAEGHMWNMVKVNGRWYNMDLTFNDPVASPGDPYPLEADFVGYTYFLVPNQWLDPNLTVDSHLFELPAANSIQENYYVYFGYYADNYDYAKERLGEVLRNAVDKKQKYVTFRFASPELYDYATSRLFKDPYKDILKNDMVPKGYAAYFTSKYNYRPAPKANLFVLTLIYV